HFASLIERTLSRRWGMLGSPHCAVPAIRPTIGPELPVAAGCDLGPGRCAALSDAKANIGHHAATRPPSSATVRRKRVNMFIVSRRSPPNRRGGSLRRLPAGGVPADSDSSAGPLTPGELGVQSLGAAPYRIPVPLE